jgi:hypothetical protein
VLDRLGPSQSSPKIRVGQHPHRSDWSGELIKPVEQQVGKEFTPKGSSIPEGREVQSNAAKEVIKIGNNDIVMGDCFNGPVIISGSARA